MIWETKTDFNTSPLIEEEAWGEDIKERHACFLELQDSKLEVPHGSLSQQSRFACLLLD